jgi:hypothetical protein
MSDIANQFYQKLQEIDEYFQSKKLAKLRVTIRGAASNISNLMDVLLRKSLIKQDAYNYDDDTEGFKLPEEKNFMENEKGRIIYERLKATVNALEYQAGSMPETLDEFTEEYMENNRKLLEYFAFHNLGGANNLNSRTLKEMTDRVVSGNDEIFKKVMQDNLKLLTDTFRSIQSFMEEITKFKKDEYKVDFRFNVFPHFPKELNENLFDEKQTAFLEKLEEFMKKNIPEIHFNKLWAPEAVKDCFSMNNEAALEKLVSFYQSDDDKKKSETAANSPRERLLKIIFNMANSRKNIEDIYYDFDYNLKLIKNREKSFIEKFQEVMMKLFNITNEEDFCHIEYINPTTKTVQKDVINVVEFMLSIKKKIALFTEITKPNSTVYVKINHGTEEALYNFLDDNYFNLLLMKERLLGLDAEIRLGTAKKIRIKFRNIINPVKEFDVTLTRIGEQRRKFIIDQENFSKQQKK